MLQLFKNLLPIIVLVLVTLAEPTATPFNQPSEITGILFYKPDCPDCLEAMESVLPEALAKYKTQNKILAVNTFSSEGSQLYLEIILERELPASIQLPALITKEDVWSGLAIIRQKLPERLALLSGLQPIDTTAYGTWNELVSKAESSQTGQVAMIIDRDFQFDTDPLLHRYLVNFLKDPLANSIAVVVLVGMMVSLIWILIQGLKKQSHAEANLSVLYALLCCALILIAFYLVYSGFTESALSCGPIGECNTVQQSRYAYILGIIPVSLLGLLVFLCCFILWLASKLVSQRFANPLIVAVWLLSVSSVLFFIYLTFLEPFVIGATCIWCLTTALLTTLSALISTKPANSALNSMLNRANRQ